MHALPVPVYTPGFDLSPMLPAGELLHQLAAAKPAHAEGVTLLVPVQRSMLSKHA